MEQQQDYGQERTVTDEAFIHLCIINYSATWKAQEKWKSGEDVEIPVGAIDSGFNSDSSMQITNTVIKVS